MKNISKNIEERNVPSIHPGCSLAETGWNDYDDFDNPLKALDIIPEDTKKMVLEEKSIPCEGEDESYVVVKYQLKPGFTTPASVRTESHMNLILSAGVHFMPLFKEKGVNLEKAWVFMDEKFVEELRKFPYKHHLDTVAYGEFFRLPNNDTFSLQEVEYFEGWRVVCKWQIDGKGFVRPETPQIIIQLTL